MTYAASIKRPHALAIVRGEKLIEYRGWCPRLVGPGDVIAIHASRYERGDVPEIIGIAEIAGYLRRSQYADVHHAIEKAHRMYGVRSRGLIDLPLTEAVRAWWKSGEKCGWLFRSATSIDPVAVTGKLGVWPVTVTL